MTLPRPVVPGDTVMAQKRCFRGEFRLRPDADVVQVYLYVLGYVATKYGIVLHEFTALSNHDHTDLTDPQGNRPKFIQQLHSLVARALNRRFGEWDSLWSGQRHSAVKLVEPQDSLYRCTYIVNNCVKAGLVRYAWDWEGPTSWHMEYGKPATIERPKFFFTENMPETVELTIHRPPGVFPELSDRDARAAVRELAKQEQADIIAERKAQGGSFMGMKHVLRQSRHARPSKDIDHRGIRPHIACKSKWARIEALQGLKTFWTEHRDARLRYEEGEHDVVFPHGTYLMKVRFGVRVAQPP